MKEYEEFLKKLIDSYDSNNPNNTFLYECKNNEKMLIDKLKEIGLITNVTYMGMTNVRFDLTYDALHYFDENEEIHTAIIENVFPKKYDVFLSHANKDKVDYVEELYYSLKKLGISIFYDKETLTWGDNWKNKILNGTHDSEFAIIVISNNFFGREWTEKEVLEFLSQENESGQKLILPIVFGISYEELSSHYPEIGDIQTISSKDYNTDQIALLFANVLIKRLKNLE